MADHDHGYKLLFSNPRMVEDLLRGFVNDAWVDELDFATLERVSSVHISDDLRERADDMIWRVLWRERWVYIFILLEFQSTSPWDMAVRIMTYVGLLYQELIRSRELTHGGVGKLPPVLPIVLYNGERPWSAAGDINELIEPVPPALGQYQPRLRYLLLDEGRFPEEMLAGFRNLVAALFRLEQGRHPEDIRVVVDNLIEWLQEPELGEVKRAFVSWLRQVLLPSRLPGVEIPEVDDLGEVKAMLSERVREWTRPWVEQGMQQGMQQGIQQGMQQGIQQGMQQGIQQGMQQGMQQGEAKVLMRLIESKFGELPDAYYQQIVEADEETILRWSDRLLAAQSLDQIFEGAADPS